MSIQITYKNNNPKKSKINLVLFADEKFSVKPLKKFISASEFSYIDDLLKTSDLKKNLIVFKLNSKKKIILISIKKNLKSFDIENLGAELYRCLNNEKDNYYIINTDSVIPKYNNFIGYLLHGLKLKSYEFNKYRTKKKKDR